MSKFSGSPQILELSYLNFCFATGIYHTQQLDHPQLDCILVDVQVLTSPPCNLAYPPMFIKVYNTNTLDMNNMQKEQHFALEDSVFI